MPIPGKNFNELNQAQEQAVRHKGSHLLIVAGPGTGKTHTLTCRIIHLIEQLKKDERILAITFTQKAAGEMRDRISKYQTPPAKNITLGTFHSFCLDSLRQNIHHTSLPPDFQIAAPDIIDKTLPELWPNLSVKERKNSLEQINQWKSTEVKKPMSEKVGEYNRFLRSRGYLDFDDILTEFLALLKKNHQVQEQVRKIFKFIFVDEYQDINPPQHAILKILVGEGNLLTAIGDPNQAIYGFRGSDVSFFESFQKDFPGAAVLELSENYRSAENLLKASGQVIAKGRRFTVPPLTAKIFLEGRLTMHEAPTDKAEAEYVVHQIERLIGGTSMFSMDSGRVANHEESAAGFADIAILYRLNSQRRVLEEALGRSGIPYRVSGDKPFYQTVIPLEEDSSDDNNQKVSLMTLHASKGLEFPIVFIIGCEHNIIPLSFGDLKSDVEEERRLFYVGMTRAKQKLYLLNAKRRCLYGKLYDTTASPFLADIAEELKAFEEIQKKIFQKKSSREKQMDLFSE